MKIRIKLLGFLLVLFLAFVFVNNSLAEVTEPKVAGGYYYTLLIKWDGTLWAWGDNDSGQLGDTTTSDRSSPVQVGDIIDWVSVAGGTGHTVAIRQDGSLWAWGRNNVGQLGYTASETCGSDPCQTYPRRVGSDYDWVAVTAGSQHNIALKEDGTLWAWGWNEYGTLGLGNLGTTDTTDRSVPTQIGFESDWAAIEAGYQHTLALKEDGSLHAWGRNHLGQLGYTASQACNFSDCQSYPWMVGTDYDWVLISGGEYFSTAVKSGGQMYAWGNNDWGQLGMGDTTIRYTPTPGLLGNVVSISAGKEFAVALTTTGLFYSWGINTNGQLGYTSTDTCTGGACQQSPGLIGTDTDWDSMSAGGGHTIAFKDNGELWAWGMNNNGQLGDGTTAPSAIPIQVYSCTDIDGDTYCAETVDCKDSDDTVYPGALELCDGQDNDCDGSMIYPALIDNFDGTITDADRGVMYYDVSYPATGGCSDADTWASTLIYGGYSDWRLPSPYNSDGSGPCEGICSDSELGHLHYIEDVDPYSDQSPFTNLRDYVYWTDPGCTSGWICAFHNSSNPHPFQ
jgi:alpha-tubulin suppressor-like RCC1 family protein